MKLAVVCNMATKNEIKNTCWTLLTKAVSLIEGRGVETEEMGMNNVVKVKSTDTEGQWEDE